MTVNGWKEGKHPHEYSIVCTGGGQVYVCVYVFKLRICGLSWREWFRIRFQPW